VFKKLRNKFLMLNMVITSLVILAAFGVIYATTYTNMYKEKLRKLNNIVPVPMAKTDNLADAPSNSVQGEQNIVKSKPPMLNSSLAFLIRTDFDGTVLLIDSFVEMPDQIYYDAASYALQHGKQSTVKLADRYWMYSVTQTPEKLTNADNSSREVYYRIAFLDITDSQKTLQDLRVTFLAVSFILLVVIYYISRFYSNRSIKPIMEVWENQRQFIADASHELKTPLSIITANYDALLANQNETIISQMEWLDYMKIGTERMDKLINDLLALAKMENVSIMVDKAPFNISEIVINLMATMEAVLREKEITLTHSVEQNIMINSDCNMVTQLFTILYDNAIKYSDTNGSIDVTLKKSKNSITCQVKNSGKGIAPQDIPKIFDRFYRADSSRTGENSGYGLGLSIAKTIVKRLGGEIAVESKENGWTIFTFKLKDML
jgi:two-component system, OmpR family, sensor histidine kinase CiaH